MTTTTRTAFATFDQMPELSPDDQLLLPELKRLGVLAEPAVWSNDTIDWSKFSAVVIRSCWDYHHRHEAFLSWLSKLEQLGITVWNQPSLIRWNLDKIYLRDLEAKGFTIIPTIWSEPNGDIHLSSLLRSRNWKRAVFKPRISASGYCTVLLGPEIGTTDSALVEQVLQTSGGMIQHYLEAVETEGEWSLIFFNKRFSHAVLKRPKTGEFRVQLEHGGIVDVAKPPPDYIDFGQDVVNAVDGPLLFARVDGVAVNGRFTLMELELIEPYLFLSTDRFATRNFAEAIASLVA
jgi:glutathione synthase/RimK-type ligase-like ATP-grasp enzyme